MSASLPELPVFGVGHSLGCLVHLLICSRYAVQRAGNVFMSYNDKPLEDIPFLAPAISPSARMLGPILSQVCKYTATREDPPLPPHQPNLLKPFRMCVRTFELPDGSSPLAKCQAWSKPKQCFTRRLLAAPA